MSRPVIALDTISRTTKSDMQAELAQGCSDTGASSCGSSSGQGDLPDHVWQKVKDHPCYSEEAHHYFARMHVAVAPACNIQCNYCNRKYDCSNESRPGVVSERMTPEQAARKVKYVAAQVPQLSVLGIAGPGDALANANVEKTFETFERVSADLPDIKLCLSTNGLGLPDHVERIKQFNVDHVTITMNCIDPEIGAKIYPWIFFEHKRHTGVEAAKILIERQLKGLEMLVEAGILVKVNSVMIPGINDEHLKEVGKAVKERGAFLHNVMPLISDPAHGTHFGLTGQRGPTDDELKALQDSLSGGAKLMKHCRQCRADAVGLLGEDRGGEFTLDKIPEDYEVDTTRRETYREYVTAERADRNAAKAVAEAELAAADDGSSELVAVCTKGGGRINQHFGHATEFQIYEVNGEGVRFVGHRRVENYCKGGYGDEEVFDTIVRTLDGIAAVLTAKIGDKPREKLAKAGITAVEDHAFEYIEPSVAGWFRTVHGNAATAKVTA